VTVSLNRSYWLNFSLLREEAICAGALGGDLISGQQQWVIIFNVFKRIEYLKEALISIPFFKIL
jgi:hypothetical protein